jgi:hypothetical protein
MGMVFPTRQIFDEGHELTPVEAGVLNQTRDENLRNNYSAQVKKAMKEAKVDKPEDLPDEAKADLLAKFPTFEEAYEFGSRGGAREVDPVRKQALIFATGSVKKAIQKKGMKISEVGPDKIREMAEAAVEKYPKFMEKATKVVAARNEAAQDLDIDITS